MSDMLKQEFTLEGDQKSQRHSVAPRQPPNKLQKLDQMKHAKGAKRNAEDHLAFKPQNAQHINKLAQQSLMVYTAEKFLSQQKL